MLFIVMGLFGRALSGRAFRFKSGCRTEPTRCGLSTSIPHAKGINRNAAYLPVIDKGNKILIV